MTFYGHPPARGGLPYALVTGSNGDVYVTGLSRESHFTNELTTIKYDSSGQLVWVDRFLQTNASSAAIAIVLDQFENVYVTGNSILHLSEGGGNYDYLTIKYNQSGERQWVAHYGGPSYDSGSDLQVDQAGNVYVAGSTGTIKYAPDGTRQWGPVGIPSGSIQMTDDGSFYVAGSGGVARYSSDDGTELWRRTVTGFTARKIAIAGNYAVCVTGRVKGAGLGEDYFTAKYTADGTQLWAARYNGLANNSDAPVAIHVGGDETVIVTGYSYGLGTNDADFVTLKYDGNGNLLWKARYNGPANRLGVGDVPTAMVVDPFNQVYVTGWSYGAGGLAANSDFVTVKYDPHGNQIWTIRFDRVESSYNDDHPMAIAVDRFGAIYVTGYSYGPTLETPENDFTTVKYLERQIIGLPAVLTQPRSQTVSLGSTVTFSVAANGEPPLTYQWRFQGNPMPGETNSNLVLTNVQFANAGDYSVEVTNPLGAVRTPEATLTFPTRMTAPAFVNNGRFRFTVEGDAGRYFGVQATTNFINWLTLTNVLNTTGATDWTNTTSTLKRRYFRAIQQP